MEMENIIIIIAIGIGKKEKKRHLTVGSEGAKATEKTDGPARGATTDTETRRWEREREREKTTDKADSLTKGRY